MSAGAHREKRRNEPRSEQSLEVETDVLEALVLELRHGARRNGVEELANVPRSHYDSSVKDPTDVQEDRSTVSPDDALARLRQSIEHQFVRNAHHINDDVKKRCQTLGNDVVE